MDVQNELARRAYGGHQDQTPVDADGWAAVISQRQEERASAIADSFARAEAQQALWKAEEEKLGEA